MARAAAGGSTASVGRGAPSAPASSIASRSFSPIRVVIGGGERAGSGISRAEVGLGGSPSTKPSINSLFGPKMEAVKAPNPDSRVHNRAEVSAANTRVIVQAAISNQYEGLFSNSRLFNVKTDLGTQGQIDRSFGVLNPEKVAAGTENNPVKPDLNQEVSVLPKRPLSGRIFRAVSEIASIAIAKLNVDPVSSSDEQIIGKITAKKGAERVAEKVKGALVIIRGNISAQNIVESIKEKSWGDFLQRRRAEDALRAANIPVALAQTATSIEVSSQTKTNSLVSSQAEIQSVVLTQQVVSEKTATRRRVRTKTLQEEVEKTDKKRKFFAFRLDEENFTDRIGQLLKALEDLAVGAAENIIDPRQILDKVRFALSAAVIKIKGRDGVDGTINEFNSAVTELRPDTFNASREQVLKIATLHRPSDAGPLEADKDITQREIGEALGNGQEALIRRIIVTQGSEEVVEQIGTLYTVAKTDSTTVQNIRAEETTEEIIPEKDPEAVIAQPILRPIFGQRPIQPVSQFASRSPIKEDLKLAA